LFIKDERYTKTVSRKALRPKSTVSLVSLRCYDFWVETPVVILAGDYDVSEKLVFVYPTIFARIT